jgi:hypothetical protein
MRMPLSKQQFPKAKRGRPTATAAVVTVATATKANNIKLATAEGFRLLLSLLLA